MVGSFYFYTEYQAALAKAEAWLSEEALTNEPTTKKPENQVIIPPSTSSTTTTRTKPKTTTKAKTDNAQIDNPANHNYVNPDSYEVPKMPVKLSLMDAVALGSPYYSIGLETFPPENVNVCFLYKYGTGINLAQAYKQAVNRGMNVLCNRYSQMMKSVETVIRTQAESWSLTETTPNDNEIICGWFNGGFSNVVNIVYHEICLNSQILYHEVGHLLNYRWAYLYCDNCLIKGYALFNHNEVKIWTQGIIDQAASIYLSELGEMNPTKQALYDAAYSPSEYAKLSALERLAEMFMRDMYNIENNRSRNRLDVLLFDSLGWG